MKIGILTYQRAENYGALLQAYALMNHLRGLGYDVSFVDYWPQYHVEHYKLFSLTRLKRLSFVNKIKYIGYTTLWVIPRMLRKIRLEKFMHERLLLGKTIAYQDDNTITEEYDAVLYGSDQIWRRQTIHYNEFNPWYFGSYNVRTKKRIAFAASMGTIDVQENEEIVLKNWLENFSNISVRESDLKTFLERIGIASQQVIDPTFLLHKEDWRKLYRSYNYNGKYILFYNLLETEESVAFANELSYNTGLPIKEINMNLQLSHVISRRYESCASIERFLQLIDGAEYVVSNSFHGVAFSLIFEKQFWAVGMGEKSNRVKSLLNNVGISDRYISKVKLSFNPTPSHINYKMVNSKLNSIVDFTNAYLSEAIEK